MRTTCPQKLFGTFFWNNNALVWSNRCLFFLSAMLFCCGVRTQEDSWMTLSFWPKRVMTWLKYSFALYDLSFFMDTPNWVSINEMNFWKTLLTPDLCLRRKPKSLVYSDNWYAYVIYIFKSHNNYLIFLSFIAFFVLEH